RSKRTTNLDEIRNRPYKRRQNKNKKTKRSTKKKCPVHKHASILRSADLFPINKESSLTVPNHTGSPSQTTNQERNRSDNRRPKSPKKKKLAPSANRASFRPRSDAYDQECRYC
uniref:Uncharacterized protein n=2 Tax=Ixodes scapularis TaxID=6945 RepID=A0A1S4LKE7_IXOSC